MGSTTAVYVIAAVVIGTIVGWQARNARGAHADLKVHQARIPMFRRARLRSGLTSAVLLVLTALALRDLIH